VREWDKRGRVTESVSARGSSLLVPRSYTGIPLQAWEAPSRVWLAAPDPQQGAHQLKLVLT